MPSVSHVLVFCPAFLAKPFKPRLALSKDTRLDTSQGLCYDSFHQSQAGP